MVRALRQYGVLSLLLVCAIAYEAGNLTYVFSAMRHPKQFPSAPFSIQIATRTIGNGPLNGDQILSLNGHPFTAASQFNEAVYRGHPGDKLQLVLSEPSGRAIEKTVEVGNQASNYDSFGRIALTLSVDVLIPFVCLGLGFLVAFVRPTDRNAWLLLALLAAFASLVSHSDWYPPWPDVAFFWDSFGFATWAVWMMLFAIYFPTRFAPDRERPWLKYVLLVPGIAVELFFVTVLWVWAHDVNASLLLRPMFSLIYFGHMVFEMLAVSAFFTILGMKGAQEPARDDRRRLKILRTGASVALGPMFLVVLYALFHGSDLFNGLPAGIEIFALCMMAVFPVTMAYVIVVERAMDLKFVVRQSMKYGLARGGLWLVRASFIALAVYVFTNRVGKQLSLPLVATSVVGLVVVRRRNSEKASAWLDRRFFREAYDSEVLLGELAGEVGRYVEIDPLFEAVAKRISETLHVTDVVILVREGDVYKTRYSTRHGQPMDIVANSRLLSEPGSQIAPLQVYYDSPQPWMRALTTEELQTLAYMRTELLLVMRGRGGEANQVIGLMSLGPKKSEEPYSKTDMSLLQTVAVQMGMAIQNSRLAASLAESAAIREVMNREVEIAREVQERLFPQKFPQVAGLDCFGYCRPARGVGGDYYDFLDLQGGRIGIAIGDVSGKGIAAALLMASLQASLRGQAMAGNHDLASLMRNVNKLVYDASPGNKYATFFYGEFDPATHEFAYVNGGHNPPVVLRAEETLLLEATGPVVGLLPGVDYSMAACKLQPGDILVCYTDGINEAMNEQDEEWDDERFIAAARSCTRDGAKDMIHEIFRKADAFTGNAKQHDDMTLLIIKLVV